MSMVRQREDGTYRVYVKGSLQTMLPCCTHIFQEGKISRLDDAQKSKLMLRDDTQATNAMRNLSYAYKDIPTRLPEQTMDDAES